MPPELDELDEELLEDELLEELLDELLDDEVLDEELLEDELLDDDELLDEPELGWPLLPPQPTSRALEINPSPASVNIEWCLFICLRPAW